MCSGGRKYAKVFFKILKSNKSKYDIVYFPQCNGLPKSLAKAESLYITSNIKLNSHNT